MRNLRYAIAFAAAVFVVSLAFAANPSKAAPAKPAPQAPHDIEKDGAAQAVAVFLNCAHFGRDVSGLRDWAKQTGLVEAPPDRAKTFLMGKAGKAFGGSTPSGDLVVASQDSGTCTVYAGHADSTDVVRGFEAWLGQNNFKFTPPKPKTRNAKSGVTIVSHEYAIRGEGGRWHAVISTIEPGKARFEAILTAYRTGKQ